VYLEQQKKLANHVRAFLREKYQIDLANVVIEQPPKVEMGEFALPLSFELAKRLRKAPRKIAEEIVSELPLPEGFDKFEVAGAGYINARLKRGIAARALATTKRSEFLVTPARVQPMSAAKFSSSTPVSIPTKRRTLVICVTLSLATPSFAC
jgi:arginyl-tRNA synthetase